MQQSRRLVQNAICRMSDSDILQVGRFLDHGKEIASRKVLVMFRILFGHIPGYPGFAPKLSWLCARNGALNEIPNVFNLPFLDIKVRYRMCSSPDSANGVIGVRRFVNFHAYAG